MCIVPLRLCGWDAEVHGLLWDLFLFLCTLLFGVDIHSWFFCKRLLETYVRTVFFYCDLMCCIFNALLFFRLDILDGVV